MEGARVTEGDQLNVQIPGATEGGDGLTGGMRAGRPAAGPTGRHRMERLEATVMKGRLREVTGVLRAERVWTDRC